MATTKDTSYGNPSLFQKIGIAASLIFHLPFVVGWTFVTSPFHRTNKHKTWRRVLGDKTFYHLTRRLTIKQMQWMVGDEHHVYEAWMKKNKRTVAIDELGENSRLLWVTERRKDRVILFVHGGTYLLPMADFVPKFWDYIRRELGTQNKDPGLVILQYSLVPTARFPTQLKQAVLAIQRLLSMGLEPQNIQLTGDSGGANLILKLFSHMLHPVPEVPHLSIPSPFAGAFFMSPWVSLISKTPSMVQNGDSDVVSIECLTYWGNTILEGVPDSQRLYLEPIQVPDTWFEGLPKIVDRVLITTGDRECMRDDIVAFVEKLRKYHPRLTFEKQEYGVHDDPYFDFFTNVKKKGPLTPMILKFFAEGFEETPR